MKDNMKMIIFDSSDLPMHKITESDPKKMLLRVKDFLRKVE